MQEPGVLFLVRCVTLASCAFQTLSVEDRELAAAVADQFALAQSAGGSSNAGAANTQHVSQEFMREVKFRRMRPIAGHQKPTGEPRLHQMEAGAGSCLCQLLKCYVEVTVQTSLHLRATFEL